MNKGQLFGVLVWMALLLAACASPGGTPATSNTGGCTTDEPATTSGVSAPQPEAGTGTVVGRVVSAENCEPVDDITVYLGEVLEREDGEAPFWRVDGAFSPADVTDSTGAFTMTNIEANDYVFIVGDLYSKKQVIRDPVETDNAQVYSIPADEVFDLGEVRVDPNRVTR